jgi:hypothetical protein
MRLRGALAFWVIMISIALAILAMTLDLVLMAVEYWMVSLPALLAAGALTFWLLGRGPKGEKDIAVRLINMVTIFIGAALAIGAVLALWEFFAANLDYLILTGVVIAFFVGVGVWPYIFPPRPPAAGEAQAETEDGGQDIVR